MKKILVLGGSGMVGRNFSEVFQERKFPGELISVPGPSSLGSNLCDYWQTLDLMKEYKPDVVIHAAANVGGIQKNILNPVNMLEDNLDMSMNVLRACLTTKVKQIYSFGSCCAYPDTCPIPFKEEYLWNGSPPATNLSYGIAKRTLLLLGQIYREQYGMKITHFIPANMFGKYDRFDLINGHVIPNLIQKFVEGKRDNKPTVECWGSGEISREFLDAFDVADLLLLCLEKEFDSELPINIGTGREIFIKDLAELIAKLAGYEGKIVFDGSVSDGQKRRQLSTLRAKELLGWEAKTSLEDSLEKIIGWYKEKENL